MPTIQELENLIQELEGVGAVASLPASPREHEPESDADRAVRNAAYYRGRDDERKRQRAKRDKAIEALDELRAEWKNRAMTAEGQLRTIRLHGEVTEAIMERALDAYQDAIDPDGRDKQWRTDEMMRGIVARGIRGAIEAVVAPSHAEPATNGSGTKDSRSIAIKALRAVKAVMKLGADQDPYEAINRAWGEESP